MSNNTTSQQITLRTSKTGSADLYVYAKQFDANSRYLLVDIRDNVGHVNISGTPQLNATKIDGNKCYIGGEITQDGLAKFCLTSQLLALVGKVTCDVSIFSPLENDTEVLVGDGVKTEFTLSEKMSHITEVKINGVATTNYSYDSETYTLTFNSAPAQFSTITITGVGILLLTTASFFIMVEESNYSDGAIESTNEFTTVTVAIAYINDVLEKTKEEKRKAEAWAVGQKDGVDVPQDDPAYHNNSKYYAEKAHAELNQKANVDGVYPEMIVGLAKNLESEEGITLSSDAEETSGSIYADEPFSMRPTAIPFDDSVVTVTNGNETIKKVNGFTVVKNQLVKNGNFATSSSWVTTRTSIDGKVVTITEVGNGQYFQQVIDGDIPVGHKMMLVCVVSPSVNCNISIAQDSNGFSTLPFLARHPLTANTRNVITAIMERKTSPANPGYARIRIGFPTQDILNVGDTLTFDFVQLIDLTKMFQSRPEIALSLEGDSGCQWFLRNFPEYTGYVDFNLGVLKSVSNFAYKTTGINLWNEEWERGTFDSTTGVKQNDNNRIRSKNFIKVPTGATLYGHHVGDEQFGAFEYNANGEYIGYANIRNRTIQLDPLCCYVNIALGSSTTPVTTYNNDIQICLKWSETAREQAYHPHTEQEINIDWSFAGGEGKSVPGGISDYKDFMLRKNHKRIASHTFTDSDTLGRSATVTEGKWQFRYTPENAAIRQSSSSEIAAVLVDGFVTGNTNQTNHCVDNTVTIGTSSGGIIFYKEDLQTIEDMKAFLIGKTLYYALETEVISDMDESEYNNVIPVDDYGLEYIESTTATAPAGFTLLYQDNLKQQIVNNKKNAGNLTELLTSDKTSLVNAINSLVARIQALESNTNS